MSSFLILINNAPLSAPYHVALGQTLEKAGHQVAYAYTDRMPIVNFKLEPTAGNSFIFSAYFKEHYDHTNIDERYRHLNLWNLFFCEYDRQIINYGAPVRSYEYYQSLLANLVNFFHDIYTTRKVDYILYENVSNSFAYAAFEVGRLHGVQYFGYCGSRLANRIEIQTEVMNMVERYSKAYDALDLTQVDPQRMKDIDTYIAKYSSDVVPSYHPANHPASYNYPLTKKYLNASKFNMIRSGLKFRSKYKDELKYAYQIEDPLALYRRLVIRQLKRKFKVQWAKSYFGQAVPGEQYFVLPLQMKPESSTSVWAKHFVDEVTLVKNIAFNLPFGTKLYVKEHFVNLGNLSMEVYKELKKIPNVRLIHPSQPNMPLLKNARGVITLTSTMGFEALVMGKKVVSFGDIFYQKHPSCTSLRSFEGLFEVLDKMKGDEQADIDVTRKFLAAYYNCTYEGYIDVSGYDGWEPDRFIKPLLAAYQQIIATEGQVWPHPSFNSFNHQR